MNTNFKNTTLDELFPGDYSWSSWDEFKSNSYAAGMAEYLGYNLNRPTGGHVTGLFKPVEKVLFTNSYTTNSLFKTALRGTNLW